MEVSFNASAALSTKKMIGDLLGHTAGVVACPCREFQIVKSKFEYTKIQRYLATTLVRKLPRLIGECSNYSKHIWNKGDQKIT
jgi:hypothetical protein